MSLLNKGQFVPKKHGSVILNKMGLGLTNLLGIKKPPIIGSIILSDRAQERRNKVLGMLNKVGEKTLSNQSSFVDSNKIISPKSRINTLRGKL